MNFGEEELQALLFQCEQASLRIVAELELTLEITIERGTDIKFSSSICFRECTFVSLLIF